MKKLLPFILACVFACGHSDVFAQAKQYILFDHFTNSSCSPCAEQNPFMEATFAANFGRYHQISYHTWWPGPTDPMYTYNKPCNHERTDYYGVSGVPDVFMLGSTNLGSPTAVTQQLINNTAYQSAPIRIRVKEISSGLTRTANITVFTVGTVPPSTEYKIYGSVNEKHIHYTSPPGSNGEKDFYNVMRKLLPDSLGDSFTPAAIGDSVNVTYTYTLDYAHWDTTQIYTVAFIQNDTSRWIVNSGSSIDPDWELVPVDKSFKKGHPGDMKSFHYKVYNLGGNAENFRFKMSTNQPDDWNADYVLNGVTLNDSTDISIPGKATWDLAVNITIGNTACLESHTISMQSLDHPEFAPNALTAYLISGINELVVNNDAGWGDGSGLNSASFQGNYIGGLLYAGSNAFGVTDLTTFSRGYSDTCMTDVQNYFYNVGWSFPAITDNTAAIFTSELNSGKRLFISGQDIGWDVFTGSGSGGHSTPATETFYKTYLGATWISDGDANNDWYIPFKGDSVFGQLDSSTLVNVYGSTNFFPDQIQPYDYGKKIFFYDATHTKIGGVRAYNGPWKTVYLSASLEQVSDSMLRKEIVKTAHDWFGGIPAGIAPVNPDREAYLGQNYPNPATGNTTIMLNGISVDMSLQILDPLGRICATEQVPSGSESVLISTASLNPGIYFYRLVSEGRTLETKRMIVAR
jgi:hypothetical protein